MILAIFLVQWLTYSGELNGQRHSPLTEITPANVAQLRAAWTFQTGTLGKFEATPLVIDGIIYTTGPNNTAFAIDARTGRQIWRYARRLPAGIKLCCERVNRGFARHGDTLLMNTLDVHLVALDMKTGKVLYDVAIDDYKKGYSTTAAPLVVKDHVIVGVSGAEFGVRGFLDAYDARTGTRAWRFWTVPEPGSPGSETWEKGWEHGGGPTWVTGSYDPELNLVYWGTGNPSPLYFGKNRRGDNLYTNSLLALDPDTGALRWHYQFTPHDLHDWDSNHVPVLADINGRKLVMVANRNGFFYTLDRTNGKLVVAKPYIHTTWANEIGTDGRPVLLPNQDPTEQGTLTCPDQLGGTNFMSPAFNPQLRLFFVTAREVCGRYVSREQDYVEGERFDAGSVRTEAGYGAVRAIDPLTAEPAWEFKLDRPGFAGNLSTASGLVFSGDADGNVFALDARTGQQLWKYQMGSPIYAAPITYMIDGKQYYLIGAGTTLTAFTVF